MKDNSFVKDALYFIAILPNPGIQHRVNEIKLELADSFGVKHALKSPPHITIVKPFRFDQEREKTIHECISDFCIKQKSFEIQLSGMGRFGSRVIFINVMENEFLTRLKNQFDLHFRSRLDIVKQDHPGQDFHPHLTIAHRDLTLQKFTMVWNYLKKQEFNQKFVCQSLALLKHNKSSWDVHQQINFMGS